jgi:hypothetical protein
VRISVQRVIYSSRWAPGLGDHIDVAVREILARSIHNNRLADVSGLLVAHDGWFVQVLEGPNAHVGAAMARISADPRHTDVVVLDRCLAECRAFRDWSLTAVRPGPEARPLLAELGLTTDQTAFTRASAMKLLSAIGDMERRRERADLGLDAA